ncbi:Acetylornithine deacetylase/Succinyl-diaminopimelate desuccinylase [Streptomyces sp. DvalAA-14]|uniref:dipeptidase n=1 Tax=unclassified Streptomyces TaxID=2593676 RepID=UPI00081B13B8|nr:MULTISPECIES: dipeptidase [unclassified Streptomyces]MYS19378.1 M20/M25/M40 family metallo-hydrolase [Streptomyces sp. SID4948]SCD43149.1 Acetylornithine deacetylase/Succinyl-diaminopimelate desuccinylase [Streptomyces sp. DvalAA-14]
MSVQELGARVGALTGRARDDLALLVGHRSVADPRQYPDQGCRQAAEAVARLFAAEGFAEVRLLDTPDGSRAVFGHRPGPPGAPTVLLYSHYDVQPPLDEEAWRTPPWTLTERDGRWYGRGAADCKGNIVAQLTALRALGDRLPVGVKVICEGSEEQSTGGLSAFVRAHPDLLRADSVLVCDTGNAEAGLPTATTHLRGSLHLTMTVSALSGPVHSGTFGGPAPDPLNALIALLAPLHNAAGDTTVPGVADDGRWQGADYPAERYRRDAGILPGVGLAGSGTPADMLWARHALTVVGIDCPAVVGSAPAVQAAVRAKLNVRIPYGSDVDVLWKALRTHLEASAPWNVRVEFADVNRSQPFRSATEGPAYAALATAMEQAFGRPMTTVAQGGSIPVCVALQETFPDAEIMLIGVEEPRCLIHAPNESVDPSEIERTALALALFLRAGAGGRS